MIEHSPRVNVGCGQTPTAGWMNFDNSPSIRLARYPSLVAVLTALGLLRETQREFIHFAKGASIRYADATQRLPLPTSSVEVLYSSHMLEHLVRSETRDFLREAMRVLRPGGILRLAVPDLEICTCLDRVDSKNSPSCHAAASFSNLASASAGLMKPIEPCILARL